MMSDYVGWKLAQVLIARRTRSVDPRKSIDKVQSANWGTPSAEVENAVAQTLKAVRKARSEAAQRRGS
jgi:hypothetical protein